MENLDNKNVKLMEANIEEIKKIARCNFSIWNQALKTGDQKKVAELYAEGATFLPTVSGEFKKGRSGAEEYFKHFLEKKPTGEIVDDEVQTLGPDIYLHSGMYNFELGTDDKKDIVKARFSYVVRLKEDGSFEILHHHSSIKPE
ncbi:MAG: SgcJ/EcaC family oxidoreductase [Patescibacteria group bacterium]|nr:SgcJ/EcaC family oxidoreductase [Patescibacteria group bacterium]